MPVKENSPAISKRWICILRTAWIVLVVGLIALMLFGWQLQYRAAPATCADPICAQADLDAFDLELLTQSLGISPAAGAALNIGLDLLAILPFFIMGSILFSHVPPPALSSGWALSCSPLLPPRP
ncbi:MAG: hypothetical protein WEA61_02920 [Anaerolineales bacterium]